MLSWEFCRTVFDTITGLVLVDPAGKIIYINRHDAALLGITPEAAIGREVQSVIPDTKIHLTVADRKPVIADLSYFNGLPYYSTRFPLYHDGEFLGVVDYDIFDDKAAVQNFLAKISSLTSELDFYKNEVRRLRQSKYSIDNIIGISSGIEAVRQEIRAAAGNNLTVLIYGETGTGKELTAHAIHALSGRPGNFVSLNCAAVPAELFEAELFGYDEGAFTNAKKGGKKGKFELADQGTLFLDEIDQLPLALQPKLLRAIQEREIDRVGGRFPVSVDIRIICAANRELPRLIEQGRFREDLYYRLNVIPIKMPPLRHRLEDIPLLVHDMILRQNSAMGRRIEEVDNLAFELLQSYHWPGNIRELQNIIERGMLAADSQTSTLKAAHLPASLSQTENLPITPAIRAGNTNSPNKNNQPDKDWTLAAGRKQGEQNAILQALREASGNKSKAAKLLGISRALLYQKLRRYQLEWSDM